MSPSMEWAISGAVAAINRKTGFNFETAEVGFETYTTSPNESWSIWVRDLPAGIKMGGSNHQDLETADGDFWLATTTVSPSGQGFSVLEISLVDKSVLLDLHREFESQNGMKLHASTVSVVSKSVLEVEHFRRMEEAGHNKSKKRVSKSRRQQSRKSRRANRK